MNLFKYVGDKTVEIVLKEFHNLITKLENLISYHESEAVRKNDEAGNLIRQAIDHEKEKARASRIAQKLKELLE